MNSHMEVAAQPENSTEKKPDPLSFESLQEIINTLKDTGSLRADLIQFLQDMIEKLSSQKDDKNQKILLGAVIFVLEIIELEYRKKIPFPLCYILSLSPTGSQLYKILNEKISLDNTERLESLYNFYQYAQKNTTVLTDPKNIDEKLQPFVDNLLSRISDIKFLISKHPEPKTLAESAANLFPQYAHYCKQKYFFQKTSIDHIKYTQLIKFANHPECDRLNLFMSGEEKIDSVAFQKQKYMFLYSLFLYVMYKIEFEYKGTGRSPDNSGLYGFCQTAILISHTDDIPDIFKTTFFCHLRECIELLKANKRTIALLKSYQLIEGGYISSAKLFNDAESFLEAMSKDIKEIVTQPSFILSAAKSLLSYAASALIGVACFEMGSFAFSVGVGKGVVQKIGGKIGGFLFGFMGKVAFTAYAVQREENMVTNYIGESLKIAVEGVYKLLPGFQNHNFSTSTQLHDQIAQEIHLHTIPKLTEDEMNQLRHELNLYQAIVYLPCSYIPKNVKERIHHAVLSPLKQRVENYEEKATPSLRR